MINNVIIFILLIGSVLFAQDSAVSSSNDSVKIHFEPLFADSEPDSILYSPERRGFRTNAMIAVTKTDSSSYEISNFTPARLDSVFLFQKIDSQLIVTTVFDSILPFTRITVPFQIEDSTGELPVFTLDCEDSTFKKLNQIVPAWFVSFSSHEGGYWGKVTPFDARRYCAGMANFAWTISTDRFKTGYLFDSTYTLLNNRTNKAGDSVNPVIDREQFYNRLINHKEFSLGKIVDGVGGLGVWNSVDDSGFVGAFQEHSFMGVRWFTFYNRERSYAMRILAHEMGHILGFTHESTISIDDAKDPNRSGFPWMVGNCYMELLKERKVPFPDDPFEGIQ